jgi:hypothetical protein
LFPRTEVFGGLIQIEVAILFSRLILNVPNPAFVMWHSRAMLKPIRDCLLCKLESNICKISVYAQGNVVVIHLKKLKSIALSIIPNPSRSNVIGSAVGAKHQSKVDKVEAYRNAARYITITGNALNGCGLNNIDAAIHAAASDQDKDHPSPKFKFISAEELMQKQFAPIRWILPNFITEGCILFVGRPKIGKSWLALQIAMAVSAGDITLGEQCESGDVLCCALEDNERRLQFRLGGLQGVGAKVDLSHITFATEMPRIDDGAIGYLKEWVARVDNPRLIIIDCLEKVRAPVTSKQTAYTNDYTALEQFRTFANKHHVAVVVVHHDRKLDAADPFDTVSGTLGLNGAADTVIVIKKEGAGAILHATGRDIPSVERAIEPRSTNGEVMWQMLGDAVKLRINNQRSKIMEALTTTPQSPQQIAKATGMKYDNVKKLLHRMYLDATIKKEGRGRYYLGRSLAIRTGTHSPLRGEYCFAMVRVL